MVSYIWRVACLLYIAETVTASYYSMQPPGFTQPIDYCTPCCETRRQGDLIFQARILDECEISTSLPESTTPVLPESTTPDLPEPTSGLPMSTISDTCTPCCETRRHGFVVIMAKFVEDRLRCGDGIYNTTMPQMFD